MSNNQQHSDLDTAYGRLFQHALQQSGDFAPEDFVPAPNTILARRLPADTMTEGGLHLPENVQEEKLVCVVLAINEEDQGDYKPGDIIFVRGAYSGQNLPFKGWDDLLILQYRGEIDDDILGRFRRPEKKSLESAETAYVE
ncbi:MAG: co-chaperone GroES family protein [Planctomycetota bacterium]|jgi:co-chaperonin GroES (HSP10)